jgi:hypothetical protein
MSQELCCLCEEPTGKAGEDSLFVNGVGPCCEVCFDYVHKVIDMQDRAAQEKRGKTRTDNIEQVIHFFGAMCHELPMGGAGFSILLKAKEELAALNGRITCASANDC